MNELPSWHLYVLRCADGTLYTGITTDLERRVQEHQEGSGARYTRGRGPVICVGSWSYPNRSEAASAEHAFKRLRRSAKLHYVEQPGEWCAGEARNGGEQGHP